jgi:hypothetical protein
MPAILRYPVSCRDMNTSALRAVTSSAAVACLLVAVTGCSLLQSPRDANGQITASASINLTDLKVGDCIKDVNALPPQNVSKVPAVPCTTSHNGEVFAVTTSGDTSDQSYAEDYCRTQFSTYIGIDFDSSQLAVEYFQPNSASATDKTLTCIVYHKDGTTDTASLKGTAQ